MAAEDRLNFWRRILSLLVRVLLFFGLGPRNTYLLSVRGRKSGRAYSTPITLVKDNGKRWLVSPYGEVGWVRNARAVGTVTLRRGKRSESVKVTELGPEEAASVLKQYVTQVPITRPFFDARPESSLEAFIAEAPRHPVFSIEPVN